VARKYQRGREPPGFGQLFGATQGNCKQDEDFDQPAVSTCLLGSIRQANQEFNSLGGSADPEEAMRQGHQFDLLDTEGIPGSSPDSMIQRSTSPACPASAKSHVRTQAA
jgi:hypothetical protein